MERIMVIGSPGAGKSTFSRKLRDITGLPLYYLYTIWHKPDRTNISREEFDEKLMDILKEDRWIIDGNYQRTLEKRMERCDTVFCLAYPMEAVSYTHLNAVGDRQNICKKPGAIYKCKKK